MQSLNLFRVAVTVLLTHVKPSLPLHKADIFTQFVTYLVTQTSKPTAAQLATPDVFRALLGWGTQTPGANRQTAPAVGETKGFNAQDVPSDIRALLGWEGKYAVENGSAAGYNNNWKNTAEASSRDSLADNPLLLTGKYSKYRDSTYPDLPLPPGLQDDASAFAYLDTQKAYESARAEMEQSGELTTEDAGETFTQWSRIPEEILKTKPLYSPIANKWLDNGGKITVENGTWKYTNPQGVSVTYKNGYPDFNGSGLVIQAVDIGPFRDRAADFKLADQLAPNGPKNPLDTWHHHEDGRTLQEINRRTHEMFTHRGGISIMKKGGK